MNIQTTLPQDNPFTYKVCKCSWESETALKQIFCTGTVSKQLSCMCVFMLVLHFKSNRQPLFKTIFCKRKSMIFFFFSSPAEDKKANSSIRFHSFSRKESIPEDELVLRERSFDYKHRYCGHCNTTTDIKEANFFGRSVDLTSQSDEASLGGSHKLCGSRQSTINLQWRISRAKTYSEK